MKNKISILGGGPSGMAIAHYAKKLEYIKGPKVVKTFE